MLLYVRTVVCDFRSVSSEVCVYMCVCILVLIRASECACMHVGASVSHIVYFVMSTLSVLSVPEQLLIRCCSALIEGDLRCQMSVLLLQVVLIIVALSSA